jgi:hypothetical protein
VGRHRQDLRPAPVQALGGLHRPHQGLRLHGGGGRPGGPGGRRAGVLRRGLPGGQDPPAQRDPGPGPGPGPGGAGGRRRGHGADGRRQSGPDPGHPLRPARRHLGRAAGPVHRPGPGGDGLRLAGGAPLPLRLRRPGPSQQRHRDGHRRRGEQPLPARVPLDAGAGDVRHPAAGRPRLRGNRATAQDRRPGRGAGQAVRPPPRRGRHRHLRPPPLLRQRPQLPLGGADAGPAGGVPLARPAPPRPPHHGGGGRLRPLAPGAWTGNRGVDRTW